MTDFVSRSLVFIPRNRIDLLMKSVFLVVGHWFSYPETGLTYLEKVLLSSRSLVFIHRNRIDLLRKSAFFQIGVDGKYSGTLTHFVTLSLYSEQNQHVK